MKLAEVNRMTQPEFVDALGSIFEHSPWVAERVWPEQPFASLNALHSAMVATVNRAKEEEQLALLRAHPELGTRARVSAASAGEQRGAGLDSLTPDEYRNLQTLGEQYRAKFGFPFIFAVKGSGPGDILLALIVRLNGTPEDELRQALWEVGRIAWFRLQEAIQES